MSECVCVSVCIVCEPQCAEYLFWCENIYSYSIIVVLLPFLPYYHNLRRRRLQSKKEKDDYDRI